MAVSAFFEESTRRRAAQTVKEIESQSAAEVVIAVRRRAAPYRGADYLGGFILSLATLSSLIYLPTTFPLDAFPLDVTIAFVVGTLAVSRLPILERLLTRRKVREQAVRAAAHAALVELGVTRTRGRTGLLVYVSTLERHVELVTDLGLDVAQLGSGWTDAVARLNQALRGRADVESFFVALAALGPLLGRVAPRSADDVNELPDELDVG